MKHNTGAASNDAEKGVEIPYVLLHRGNTLLAGIVEMFDKTIDKSPALVPQYEPATLHAPKQGAWLIIWYNIHPETGQLTRLRKTFGLGCVKDKGQRKKVAAYTIAILNRALAVGYNYFVDADGMDANEHIYRPETSILELGKKSRHTIEQALWIGTEARMVGMVKRTAGSYKSFTTKFCEYLKEHKMLGMPADELTALHFQLYINYKSSLGHGNRNINDHINFFKTTFGTMKKLKLVKSNPIEEFIYLPETESSLFQPPTNEELIRIAAALIPYPHFYLFTCFTAHDFIRPYHVTMLKASDIDYVKDTIRVRGEASKNKKHKVKQMMAPVKRMLLKLDLHKLPGDFYLFSDRHFKPGPTMHESLSIRAAEFWKELIIDGLGINKKLYSLKAKGAQDYVNENESPDLLWLQTHMEHSSFTQTEIYLQGKVSKRINENTAKTIAY